MSTQFVDGEGNARDPNLSGLFWNIIMGQNEFWVSMMGHLGKESFKDEPTVKNVFDWDSPNYDFDFRSPPDVQF